MSKCSGLCNKENFIFKGGFILSKVVEINARRTVDIDLYIKMVNFLMRKS
ncbi:MAG: nucleotidyl transferase AbiEii/AbiGii toxin family protein [Pleomorphochaeta sp.]